MTPRDERKLVKTTTPGIYRRVNANGEPTGSYVCVFRAGGKQRRRSAKTFSEAKAIKRAAETDHDRGEYQAPDQTRFCDYMVSWIETYQGKGSGFRDGTRAEYTRLIKQYALPYFSELNLKVHEVTAKHIDEFVAWLASEEKQGRQLSRQSIANALSPLRAGLSTAVRQELIRRNPTTGVVIPHPNRERVHDDDEEEDAVKVLSREQLRLLLDMTPERYKLLVTLIASTGLRISEAIGLQRRHLRLDGSKPHVRIRRAIVKGRIEPPKTRHGEREVPLSHSLVLALRAHLSTLPDGPDAIVFTNASGTAPIESRTVRNDFLKSAMEEIGAPGLSFHSLRHTYTSLQIARGVNIVALSRALGHHSAAFTLTTYAHLLKDDEVQALDLSADVELIVPGVVPADLVG